MYNLTIAMPIIQQESIPLQYIMLKTQKYLILSLLLLAVSSFSVAQTRKEKKGYISTNIDDDLITRQSNKHNQVFFSFPNVNKISRYYNVAKRQHIMKLIEQGKDEAKLKKALEHYISNFGIRNFSEDTEFLWLLAQLYEKNGELEKAKSLYRLVLRHQKRNTIPHVSRLMDARQRFHDLTKLEQEMYVPLDYYYELVEYRKDIDTLHPPKSILTNMGDLVNHNDVADYGPNISLYDLTIIFTKRTVDSNHLANDYGNVVRYSENLYVSQGYEDGFWDEAYKLPAPINTGCNEGSAVLSRTGKTIYFTRCRVEDNLLDCSDCLGLCDIYTSHKNEDGEWEKPKNLGKSVNTSAWESHPALSKTEDTLYFVSSRPDGFGMSDIWFTYKVNKKGDWASAKNMGPTINTAGNEYSPYLSRQNSAFFFSSNGHVMNFGDLQNKSRERSLDIYKAYPDGNHWLEPKNVGPLVNGEGDEYYFSMDVKSKNLYYAKTEENSDPKKSVTDLYSFPVPMGAQPKANVNLHGTLLDKETKEVYKGIVSIIDLESGIEVAPKEVREDGSFDFDLIDHKKYLLIIQGDEFFRIEKLFELNGDTTIVNEATSVRNKKLQFASLVFENGKWDILPEMDKDLWNIIDFLIDNPLFSLHIGGHTDGDGDATKNQTLSQQRANSIKEFLIKNGDINTDRVEAIGYGAAKPIRSPELTDKDKQINRRVEFELISEKEETILNNTEKSTE